MEQNKADIKKVCQYCHSNIKSKEDILICPECGASYHIECWYENEGCGVYGCKYKIKVERRGKKPEITIKDILTNAEFLINTRRYIEAMAECSRVLDFERENTEAKRLYNLAVSIVNTKIKFVENGDKAYESNDLKTAVIYFKEALKYTDETESAFIRAKIKVLEEQQPKILRQKAITRILTTFIVLLVLSASVFGVYYFYYMKDAREYAEIEKGDNVTDISSMEQQISRYEKFISKFRKSDLATDAREKINLFSYRIANGIYMQDWRNALKYLNKMDSSANPKTYSDVSKNIFKEAEEEYKEYYNEARRLNRKGLYGEARIMLEKAQAITEIFPGTSLFKEKQKVLNAINLMGRKIATNIKLQEIKKEINSIGDRNAEFPEETDMESINQRLNYLKIQKSKLDSIIRLHL